MQRKEPADWVFFNITLPDSPHEAIAIYKGTIIAIGSIPYIFSNYRGFQDFNAQGNCIGMLTDNDIRVGESGHQLVVYLKNNPITKDTIIWQIEEQDCISRNIHLLDSEWDDH